MTEYAREYQVGGDHYTALNVQPWDAMESWMSAEEFAGFLRGNIIKYIARDKNGTEDLEKARHYLDRLIAHQKGTESNAPDRIADRMLELSRSVAVAVEEIEKLKKGMDGMLMRVSNLEALRPANTTSRFQTPWALCESDGK